jgi:hypothetical protein
VTADTLGRPRGAGFFSPTETSRPRGGAGRRLVFFSFFLFLRPLGSHLRLFINCVIA